MVSFCVLLCWELFARVLLSGAFVFMFCVACVLLLLLFDCFACCCLLMLCCLLLARFRMMVCLICLRVPLCCYCPCFVLVYFLWVRWWCDVVLFVFFVFLFNLV